MHRILIEAGLAELGVCQALLINLPSYWASQSLYPKKTLESDCISCMIIPKDTVLRYLLRYCFIVCSLLCSKLSVEEGKIVHHKAVGLYLLMKLILTNGYFSLLLA